MARDRDTEEQGNDDFWRRIVDWVFGYDFFISYSHEDGLNYPRRLRDNLQHIGFRVFLDQTDFVAGDNLRRETRRQVVKSRKIIVIGRRHSLQSGWVRREVDIALEHHKIPIVININRSVESAPQQASLAAIVQKEEWLRLDESIPDSDGVPSDQAITELTRSFDRTRQETKRLRIFMAASFVLAVLAATSMWQAFEANRQRLLAERQTQIANRNLEAARRAADDLVLKLARQIRTLVGVPQQVIRTVLSLAEDIVQTLISNTNDDSQLSLIRVQLLNEFAETFWLLGDADGTRRTAEQSIELVDKLLVGSMNNTRYLSAKSDALYTLGVSLRVLGETQDALAAFVSARDLLERITRIIPESEEPWLAYALSIDRIGDVLRTDSLYDRAAEEYAAAEAIRLKHIASRPGDERWLAALSWSHNRIGDNIVRTSDHHALKNSLLKQEKRTAEETRRWNEALGRYEQALKIRSELAEKDPLDHRRRRDVAWSLNLVGVAQLGIGQKDQASSSHRKAETELVTLLAGDARNAEWLRDLALTRTFLGDALLASGDHPSAFFEYGLSLKGRRELVELDKINGRWVRDLLHGYHRVYLVHRLFDQPEQAETYRKLALELATPARSSFPTDAVLAEMIRELEAGEAR